MKKTKPTFALQGLFFLISLLIILPGCESNKTLKQVFYTFGTEITLVINHPDHATAQLAIQEIEQAFYQLNDQWHAWNPDSMLSEINRALAENRSYPLDLRSYEFIKKNQQYSQQSDYLFDPAIGGLIQLWGFQGQAKPSPPSDELRQKWLAQRPSIKDISFIDQQIKSNNNQVKLDFGGSAKGLAMDEAKQILQHYSIKHALINIGGDIKVLGYKANKQAWSIGVQNPKNPAEPIARIQANNQDHIFTSGTYQRYFEWQGKTFSHIINPNTAWPADTLASVTVIHSDAILADIAATALMIAGPDDWQRIAQQLNIDRVMVIDREGQIQQTPKMAKQVTLISAN